MNKKIACLVINIFLVSLHSFAAAEENMEPFHRFSQVTHLDEGNPYLQPTSIDDLRRTLQELITPPPRRMNVAARAFFPDPLQPTKLHPGWLAFIGKVTNVSWVLNPEREEIYKKKATRLGRGFKSYFYSTVASCVRAWLRTNPQYKDYSAQAERDFWKFYKSSHRKRRIFLVLKKPISSSIQ